ncbi:MAG: hypothetical protein INR65_14650, partial [Gluconacetobacter diazotrophicus]|nr:hypothetical protein [Gluconacetobacter diazotrophicus]
DSFERFGEYDGTYRLVCDRDRDGAALCFRGIDAARWDSVRRTLDGLDTIVSARMNVLADPDFDDFQPILYIDSDVLCDRPIEGLLVAAARSERILIATEFHGQTIAEVGPPHGHWFGLFLRDADPRIDAHRCINNGIFAARNRLAFLGPFAAVSESWARFKAAHGEAHRAAYDQPFYSSVLQSLDAADTDTMNRWVRNLQGVEPTYADAPAGLTHFNVGVGMNKTQAMLRYVGLLEGRRSPARPAA